MADRPATTTKKTKMPGRKRRVVGWVLLVIGVLIAGVWGASRWWTFEWHLAQLTLLVQGGMCKAYAYESGHIDTAPPLPRFGVYREQRWDWLVPIEPSIMEVQGSAVNLIVADYRRVAVPNSFTRVTKAVLWPFALASLLGGGWLVWSGRRARRRAMSGMCRKCGYDLSGLGAGAPCPECGTEAVAPR